MITIKGTATKVSREFVRAWLHASLAVLSFHNYPLTRPITVEIRSMEGDIAKVSGTPAIGRHFSDGTIHLERTLGPEKMATTVLHELIHECVGDFGEHTHEKCTSTLTNRLKADVARLAQVLIEGTYRRAAYFAHTKLSYRATDGDHYDGDQHLPVGAVDPYKDRARGPVPDLFGDLFDDKADDNDKQRESA